MPLWALFISPAAKPRLLLARLELKTPQGVNQGISRRRHSLCRDMDLSSLHLQPRPGGGKGICVFHLLRRGRESSFSFLSLLALFCSVQSCRFQSTFALLLLPLLLVHSLHLHLSLKPPT